MEKINIENFSKISKASKFDKLVNIGLVLPKMNQPMTETYCDKAIAGNIKHIKWEDFKNFENDFTFVNELPIVGHQMYVEICCCLGWTEDCVLDQFGFSFEEMPDSFFLSMFLLYVQPNHDLSRIFLAVNKRVKLIINEDSLIKDYYYENIRLTMGTIKQAKLSHTQEATIARYTAISAPLYFAYKKLLSKVKKASKLMAKVHQISGALEYMRENFPADVIDFLSSASKFDFSKDEITNPNDESFMEGYLCEAKNDEDNEQKQK